MDEYKYVVNVDGAVVRDGEYLFIERAAGKAHASGMLAFPGGKVEQPPGGTDTIEATARRELHEEVGIEVGTVDYVLSSTFESDTGEQCINVVTLCEYVDGEARPRAPDEVATVHWLSVDELRERDGVQDFLVRDVERVEKFRQADRA